MDQVDNRRFTLAYLNEDGEPRAVQVSGAWVDECIARGMGVTLLAGDDDLDTFHALDGEEPSE